MRVNGKWFWTVMIVLTIGFVFPVFGEEKKAQTEETKAQVEEKKVQADETKAQVEEKKAQTQEKKSQVEEKKNQAEEKKTQMEEKKSAGDKAAVINGTVILREDFDREFTQFKQRLSAEGQKADDVQLTEVKKDILENLIGRELLYQESRKNGNKVEAKSIENELGNMKKMFPDETEFKNALSQMGFTEESIKAQVEKGLSIQQFIDKQFSDKIKLSDKESKDYYDAHQDMFKEPEQVKASHILIKVDPKADQAQKDTAHKKIETVQEKIKKGEDFAVLAKEFSECPSNANGGDLGLFKHGDMVKPFEDVAFALKPGTVSDIVETRFGYHLIKVTEKKAEGIVSYDKVKDKLGEYLKRERLQKEVEQYVQKLKEKASIQRFL